MRHPDENLVTPIYVKTTADMPLPEDAPVYYVLGSNGLFLCRNHPLFSSCVSARTWPTELAPHDQTVRLHYPQIPQPDIERLVGFFDEVFERHRAEAAAVLVWDREAGRIEVHVPAQRATVREGWTGRRYPLDVHYDLGDDLGPGQSPIGTIHSHGDGAAYASHTDQEDEAYRAGLHIVVGRIDEEPPEFHCEFVVDGVRFTVEPGAAMAAYERRSADFPQAWLECVTIDLEHEQAAYPAYGPYPGAGPVNGVN